MVIAGMLALGRLPLTEYPRVTPPTVVVRAAYPGADPEAIADTVAAPLEQAINGVGGMLYMSSQAAGDGSLTVTVTFDAHIDPEMAQVEVQNRVARALPRLAVEVQRLGVTTQKLSPDILIVVHLVSPGNEHDPLYLSAGWQRRQPRRGRRGPWLVAPRLAWSFLDWPQLRRRARAAGSLADAAFADYEQATLRALEEVRGPWTGTARRRSAWSRPKAGSGGPRARPTSSPCSTARASWTRSPGP